MTEMFAGMWFESEDAIPDDFETVEIPRVFANTEQRHNVKLGPFRRDPEEERKMLALPSRPENMKAVRCYVADTIDD